MNRFDTSTVVWSVAIGVFLLLEILAAAGWVPWAPLSDWIWRLERIRHAGVWIQWVLLVGLAILLVHLVARFP